MSKSQLSDSIARIQGFDAVVQAVMEEWAGPGLAMAVIKENEIIYAKGFGYRDRAQQLPVTTQTLFPIASCTKAFTTAALSILADRGMLDWDTPVRAYIPNFALYDPYATERVTPRDLVSHRTGLPRHDLVWYNNTTATRRELFERLRYLEPTKDLRTTWQYQNMMYMAAGYLVEVISGQTWEEFVQEHIFRPLGMERSNFDVVRTSQEADDYSHPYKENKDEVQEIGFYAAQAAIAPAGAIVSSITEMSNWVLMHLNRGMYKGARIISEGQINQLHSPQMVIPQFRQFPEIPYASYAMGWAVEPYRGYPMVDHSGGIDGFRSLTTLFPTEQLGVIVLSNLGQLNIPEILTYHVFERLTDLDITPWNERFMQEHRSFKEAEKEGQAQSEKKRVAGAGPSHPLAAYTGEFAHPGYGPLSITLAEDELQATFNDMTFPIKHYHYDTFDMVMERWGETMKISFLTNVKGDIDTIIAPFEPTGIDIVFRRQPNKQMKDKAFLEQFVGIYEFMQMQIVVSFMGEHSLRASFPGHPDYELEPYQGNEFLAQGASSVSIEFQRDSTGAVTGAVATLPYGVFHATKR